ncbi:MAG: cytochrome c family protein [Alphaproteobacteria bacterium]|nr:cytochrome c family protein [Alphaproteobacteria bacterium]
MTLWLLLACARPAPPPEAAPQAAPTFEPFEPAPLIRDPARGGPPVQASAAPLPPFQGVSRATARYQGSEVCAGCHPTEMSAWRQSAHAHAYETLQAAQRGFDPSCLRCHVVGLGHPGGFEGTGSTPELLNVGCEACHGPGSDHVEGVKAGYGALPKGPAACQGCHTLDNSPDFDWASYWPKVAHGG